MYRLIEEPSFLAIVMEYVPRGSVYDLLHRQRVKLSTEMAINMATDVARGMAFLHSAKPPIIHRDLKTPNLLVTESFQVYVIVMSYITPKIYMLLLRCILIFAQVKISDFGLTRRIEGTVIQSSVGTRLSACLSICPSVHLPIG